MQRRQRVRLSGIALGIVLGLGCGDNAQSNHPDGGNKGNDPGAVTVDHCSFTNLLPTAKAGEVVTSGPLLAGAAERVLDIPVGTALGAYTARAGVLGSAGTVDLRKEPLSGAFNASIGIETAPRVKVLVLAAGGETIVIIKLDLGLVYEGMLFDLENRLGPQFAGKVMLTASHSHSAWGQQTSNPIFMIGLGAVRNLVYQRYLDQIEMTANDAFAALRSAKIGIHVDTEFDPDNRVTRDRRSENDELMGGPRKDDFLALIRIDGADDIPIAVIPVYGIHGTINSEENSFASTDASGALERLFEEQFDNQVVVMHLQGSGAEVSPVSAGGYDCANLPSNPDDPCFDWLRAEGNGRNALPIVEAAWAAAGTAMVSSIEIEMLTRSVDLGPDADTFSLRQGALRYAPFEHDRIADRNIYDGTGAILSPIDEFNAPVGAALCEKENPIFPAGQMPGTDDITPYGSCVRLDTAADILGELIDIDFEADATHPVCQSTRTTISALRLGDTVIGTIPGELSVLLADRIRSNSPVAADKTILIGYAQGHVGYCLSPEDWLQGGFEPSINLWGPLEGEYLSERLSELLPLAVSPTREDGTRDGSDRLLVPTIADDIPFDESSPLAGTVPSTIPSDVWVRGGTPQSGQPSPSIERVKGIATFVWIGDDPIVATPVVTLEHDVGGGVFAPVTRRSGRSVSDGDLVLMYTGLPLRPEQGEAQTHYWALEWQAIPWIGTDTVSAVGDEIVTRGALALGTYRFRVAGANYTLTSNPFEVTAAQLGVSATRNDDDINGTVTYNAPRGYRILAMSGDSNRPIPMAGPVEVTLTFNDATTETFPAILLDAAGSFSLTIGANAANVATVSISDPFANTGISTL